MPLILPSTYCPPFMFFNGHIQTVFPAFFRKVNDVTYTRERIATPDDDFMDLDWSCVGSDRVAIILHGLEGHSDREYMRGMVRACNRKNWDAVAVNFRGCSGEPNRLLISYHHGKIDDLHTVVTHVLKTDRYKTVSLIGFSLGANVILTYLGKQAFPVDLRIRRAVAISAPCDLTSCAWKLAEKSNTLYMKRFLRMLHEKVSAKMETMPGKIDDRNYNRLKNFKDFDDRYTAPIHGFKNAEDYWTRCSSKQFLPSITIPTLILNAQNDPFLTVKCLPLWETEKNKSLFLEIPGSGGHCGFIRFRNKGEYWHETRAIEFITR